MKEKKIKKMTARSMLREHAVQARFQKMQEMSALIFLCVSVVSLSFISFFVS